MMMKAAYEMVHGPHEPWDYASVGFPAPISNPFPKQVIENRCLSLERNDELSEWVGHVTEQLIDDLPDKETHATDTRMVDGGNDIVPSSLLGDHFTPKKSTRRSYFDGNGEELQWNHELGAEETSILEKEGSARSSMISRIDENGLSLITLLLECAVAISVDNLGEAHRILLELTMMASPYGPSCAERVMAYFSKAMASRVLNSWLVAGLISHPGHQNGGSTHRSNDRRWAHQWKYWWRQGNNFPNFARRLGLPFEFHPVAKKFGEIDASMVPLRRGETLAVQWLQHSLYDATGPDWKTLRLLEALAPRVITLAEQDISNGGSFLDRFVGSLHYYSALFDSLGACLPCDDPGRHRIEHCLLYREINNILAIGGPARSGEDKFRHWRSELAKKISFKQVAMSGNSMAQAQLILNMFPPAHGYSLVQGDGILSLGWKDTSLFTVSAWTSRASEHHLI
ncbi:hypothetical protein OIU77_026002 [Salix suchowensis]|uniref:Uncharacterized protein n=1 Tax=Salix suchowensis TaxID=1278906 RepID=A0ABQ9BY72_9ROSI|nr:hypothetical protein OIU77_026002 [Salix suchowensis]